MDEIGDGIKLLGAIAPISSIQATHNSSALLQYSLVDAQPGCLVDPATGLIEVRSQHAPVSPKDKLSYDASLYLVDSVGSRSLVEMLPMDIMYADTAFDTNGPGGKDCAHGSRVDTVCRRTPPLVTKRAHRFI